jgi:DNA-binding response OmpR family regulator
MKIKDNFHNLQTKPIYQVGLVKEIKMKEAMPSVLVVDDSPKNVDLLVNTLKDDFRLGIARNGPKALDYAEKHHPDLILLDVMMPEMDGFEVCSRLKTAPETKDIPVVFLTAMSETDDKTRGFEMGAVDYITKPFRPSEVKARIRAHLTLKETREELKTQNISLKQKVEELQETLNTTVQTVAAASEIEEILNTVLNRAMMTVNARIGSIMLPDKESRSLSIAAAVGLEKSIVDTTTVWIGEGISGKVAQTGEALLVEDVEQDPVFPQRMNSENNSSDHIQSDGTPDPGNKCRMSTQAEKKIFHGTRMFSLTVEIGKQFSSQQKQVNL